MASPEEGELLQGLGPGDGDAGTVALVFTLEFSRGRQGVVFDDDGTQQHCAEDGDRMLRTIRHDEGDTVAGAHARLMQRARASTHVLGQLGVAELTGEKVDGCASGVAGGDLQDHVWDRLIRSCDFVGDSGRVERSQP